MKQLRKRELIRKTVWSTVLCLTVTAAGAAPPLRITRTEVDPSAGTLLIHGVSFGGAVSLPPQVTLDSYPLSILDYVPQSEILAELPSGLSAGTYLLTVTAYDLSASDTFNVMLGEAGGVGPQITSTAVDSDADELLIYGYNFGDSGLGDPLPEVLFADRVSPLAVIDYGGDFIAAELPAAPPGSYSLRVRVGQGESDAFQLTVGGDITEVIPGDGLVGGGVEGSVSLMVDFAGSGSSSSVAHSDHTHAGSAIVSGIVSEAYVDGAIARDSEVAGLAAASGWSLFGNTGTTGGVNFLGTTDSQPLELRVSNSRALKLEPNSSSPRVILGYSGNSVGAGLPGATIAGGGQAGLENKVTGSFGIVGGGYGNEAGQIAVVAGGDGNRALGRSNTIAGGSNNATAGHPYSTIGGGTQNTALDYSATVGGGASNSAQLIGATVSGGQGNTAGYWGAVPGGLNNQAATYGFAAGRRAKTGNTVGSFVWSDSQDFDTVSSGHNSFTARATGGVRFISAIDLATGAPTAGVHLAPGAGAWSTLSDIRYKENVALPSPVEVLSKLSQVPIRTWNYKSQADAVRHIGPSAQDFYIAFGLGESDTLISTVDADGVALAAIQGLQILLAKQNTELEQLRSRLAELELLMRRLSQAR